METTAQAPLWVELGREIVSRLPIARYRMMRWLSRPRTAPFIARFSGPKSPLFFECDLRNSLAREVYFSGQYEPQETALVRSLLRPGGVFADVGAHWGYFSLLASELVGPTGRVVSVEADPRIHPSLAQNLRINGLHWATPVHAAAAAGPGEVTLAGYDEESENWGVSRVVGGHEGTRSPRSYQVRAVAMDALLDELGIDAVELVKMDIEGAEVFALAGMEGGLCRHRYRQLLLELHPVQIEELGRKPSEVIDLLLGFGYRGLVLDHSPRTSRRAAYARRLHAADFLSPFDPSAPLGPWPHVLWLAPGVADPQF